MIFFWAARCNAVGCPQGFTSIVDKGHMLVFHSFPHSLPHMLNVDSNFDFGALWPTPKGT
jgi:hypothetical protein